MMNRYEAQHMTQEQIQVLDERDLSAIIKSTNRYGRFAQELVWAKQEADRRYRKRQQEYEDLSNMFKLRDAEDVRTQPSEFMEFWACMNDELADSGVQEAFYGDVKEAFDNPDLSPSKAAKHLMKVRGDL